MDMLAEKCGIDPFDFREMNLLQWEKGTTDPLGVMPPQAMRPKSSRFTR